MALSFTNTAGNLFNRLGRYGRLARLGAVFQGDLTTYFNSLLAQYDSSVGSPLQLPVSGVPALRDQIREAAVSAYMDQLKNNAAMTVTEMVRADKPAAAQTLATALAEVYAQMVTAGATLQKCVVAATAAAVTGNSGDGVLVVSEKRGDGRAQELIIPETAYVRVVADSQSDGATAGQESFTYTGEVADGGVWYSTFPTGSGQTATFQAIDPTVDGSSSTLYGNVLVNGNFESFTANLPASWNAVVGVAGTDFAKSVAAGTFYDGLASLQFIGGATNTSLRQLLNGGSGGSAATLYPQRSYAVNLWAKMDVAPAAGVLTVELVDGSGAVINDDQGVANSFTINLTTLGTTFVPKNGVFRTPKLLPSTIAIRLRMSTALTAARNLFVDRMGMGLLTATYNGGPGVAAFAGAAKFVRPDAFVLTTTNDFGGATQLSTFHWLLDRMFDLRFTSILFPTSAGPTIPDTLLTA